MLASNGRKIPLALAILALASMPSMVRAQGNSFNPYGNSGYADYREFSTPMVSNNPALPGQARLNQEPVIGRPRGNSYQRYLDELDALDSGLGSSSRESTSRLPYYEANRQQNRLNHRGYKPNDTQANRDFEARQKQRDAAYAKALEERDPVKRNRLLRQAEQDSLDRPSASARSKPAAGSTTPGSARSTPGAGASRATSPSALSSAPPPPVDRRSSAPPPYPTGNTRRASPPAGRTPAPPTTSAPITSTPKPDANSRPATDPSTIPIPPPR